MGDFNARIGQEQDFILAESDDKHILTLYDYLADNCISPRHSKDKKHNGFGKKLLRLCRTHNLRTSNGRCSGDQFGRYTCFLTQWD